MRPSGPICKSVRSGNKPYELNKPLENSPFVTNIPDGLRVIMRSPPDGFDYWHANEDIILVENETMIVVHAIIDYGDVPVKIKVKPPPND